MNKSTIDKKSIIQRGHLGINLPVGLLVFLTVSFGSTLNLPWLALVFGTSILGLILWSYLVARWRNWGISHGYTTDQLLNIAREGRVDMFAREAFRKIILKRKK